MNNRLTRIGLALMAALMWGITSQAQEVAVKTNLLYDATTTPNLGIEVGMGRRVTGQLFYGLNPWRFGDSGIDAKKAKHWVLMPEVRWWPCAKMSGWFLGVHAMGGQFNAANVNLPVPGAFFNGLNIGKAVRDTRVEGAFAGGGITVGYQWILSRHWNLEVEAGGGYNHIWYDQFPCGECGTKISDGHSNYIGLTKAGITLMYVF